MSDQRHAFQIFPFVALLGSAAVYFYLNSDLPTRHLGQVDTLSSPIRVTGWNAHKLQLAYGREIPLPNVDNLPATTHALSEITKRGVEITPDGHVYGLIRIYHWCGNDPVSADIRRIDISNLLRYYQIGVSDLPRGQDGRLQPPTESDFSTSGWNINGYIDFECWRSLSNDPI